jgi:hypothetical protein
MRIQFIAYFVVASLLSLISWYYAIVFCAIYPMTGLSWLVDSILSVALSWCVFQFLTPVTALLFRIFLKSGTPR